MSSQPLHNKLNVEDPLARKLLVNKPKNDNSSTETIQNPYQPQSLNDFNKTIRPQSVNLLFSPPNSPIEKPSKSNKNKPNALPLEKPPINLRKLYQKPVQSQQAQQAQLTPLTVTPSISGGYRKNSKNKKRRTNSRNKKLSKGRKNQNKSRKNQSKRRKNQNKRRKNQNNSKKSNRR